MKRISFLPPLNECVNYKPPDYKSRYKEKGPDNVFRKYAKEWKVIRERHLEKNPVCELCRERGLGIKKAYAVDHITPHKNNPRLFLFGKLRSLCRSHHARKSAREKHNKKRGL